MANDFRGAVKSHLFNALGLRQRLRDRSAVLLTFDDGPEPAVTEAILDRLRRYHARAVFFSIGCNVERAAHLLDLVRRDGHEIGNHSFAHPLKSPRSVRSLITDLTRCQAAICAHGDAAAAVPSAVRAGSTPDTPGGPCDVVEDIALVG